MSLSPRRQQTLILLGLAVTVIAVHLRPQGAWELHRDEYLYLAFAEHVQWGFWSTPPLLGVIAWILSAVTDLSFHAVRFVPAVFGAGVLFLTGRMAQRMGGGTWAVLLAAAGIALSPAYLRSADLFQPVIIDILFWTLVLGILVDYLAYDRKPVPWLALGLAVGVGLLNKYSIGVLVIALFVGLILTRHRTLLGRRAFWLSVGLALVIWSPNLLWQYQHGFPVIGHMGELVETQLVNVRPGDFLIGQLLMHVPVVLIWLAGVVFLFRDKALRPIAISFVALIVVMLVLRGKTYYTLGFYPVLFAAGGVWLEAKLPQLARVGVLAVSAFILWLVLPFSLPVLSPSATEAYGRRWVESTGTVGPLMWEDGAARSLPQDYADMMGWRDLAALVEQAVALAPDSGSTVIYGEDYGQAGAIAYYTDLEVFSFDDSYRFWAPEEMPADLTAFIYVNDELGADVDSLFGSIQMVGSIESPAARIRGTTVYLCTQPEPAWFEHYRGIAVRVRETFAP